MVASSAFVLAALTMTGVYMQSKNAQPQNDGYSIDFTALENSTGKKTQEIAQNRQTGQETARNDAGEDYLSAPSVTEDDLDYMPMEAGSGMVEIPGLTDGSLQRSELLEESSLLPGTEIVLQEETGSVLGETAERETSAAVSAREVTVPKELHFSEADGLVRPVQGEVLLPFSMDGSIYFSTLKQYKYNPALMLQADEGEAVSACAAGRVTDIREDAETGCTVTMELGNGYVLRYGQLKELAVSEGSCVSAGEMVGRVAAPTKYFSVEGANLYLKLTADDIPVNPESLFR